MKKNMGQGEYDNCNSVIYAQWVCYGKKKMFTYVGMTAWCLCYLKLIRWERKGVCYLCAGCTLVLICTYFM